MSAAISRYCLFDLYVPVFCSKWNFFSSFSLPQGAAYMLLYNTRRTLKSHQSISYESFLLFFTMLAGGHCRGQIRSLMLEIIGPNDIRNRTINTTDMRSIIITTILSCASFLNHLSIRSSSATILSCSWYPLTTWYTIDRKMQSQLTAGIFNTGCKSWGNTFTVSQSNGLMAGMVRSDCGP